jgi:hypothetical protein
MARARQTLEERNFSTAKSGRKTRKGVSLIGAPPGTGGTTVVTLRKDHSPGLRQFIAAILSIILAFKMNRK